jgi:GNAT superfamily N-acetyltransferase
MTPSANLTIEPADPRTPEAAALIACLLQEYGWRYGDDGDGDFRLEQALAPRAVFLLARLDGRAVACGAVHPWSADVAEIKRMYVEPEVRRRGIARRLLDELEAFARRHGFRSARLETGVMQPEALRLYETAGYHQIEKYGYYRDDPRSVCFEKVFAQEEG